MFTFTSFFSRAPLTLPRVLQRDLHATVDAYEALSEDYHALEIEVERLGGTRLSKRRPLTSAQLHDTRVRAHEGMTRVAGSCYYTFSLSPSLSLFLPLHTQHTSS